MNKKAIVELSFNEEGRIKVITELEEIPTSIVEEILNTVHDLTMEHCADETIQKHIKETCSALDEAQKDAIEKTLVEASKSIRFWKLTSWALAIILILIMLVGRS